MGKQTVSLNPKDAGNGLSDMTIEEVIQTRTDFPEDMHDVTIDGDWSIHHLRRAVLVLADDTNESYTRVLRHLTLHASALGNSDKDCRAKLNDLYKEAVRMGLIVEDVYLDAVLDSRITYQPAKKDEGRFVIRAWDTAVKDSLQELGQLCGVPCTFVTQVYMVKSLLTSSLVLGDSKKLMVASVDLWYDWLKTREKALRNAIRVCKMQ